MKRNKTSVDIVIPVYNEEIALPANLPILLNYCRNNLTDYKWQIIIADNASGDKTPEIAKKFIHKTPSIKYSRIKQKGRGRALRQAWLSSNADIVSYMDIDLSSNLDFFTSLVSVIENGADVAIGSRLVRGSRVVGRTRLREIMSRSLNLLIRLFFHTPFRDAQCGFKAIKTSVFKKLAPIIKNQNWFFDSELLIIASQLGFKIAEIPISWHDDPSSTVRVAKTTSEDLKGLIRLKKTQPWKKIK